MMVKPTHPMTMVRVSKNGINMFNIATFLWLLCQTVKYHLMVTSLCISDHENIFPIGLFLVALNIKKTFITAVFLHHLTWMSYDHHDFHTQAWKYWENVWRKSAFMHYIFQIIGCEFYCTVSGKCRYNIWVPKMYRIFLSMQKDRTNTKSYNVLSDLGFWLFPKLGPRQRPNKCRTKRFQWGTYCNGPKNHFWVRADIAKIAKNPFEGIHTLENAGLKRKLRYSWRKSVLQKNWGTLLMLTTSMETTFLLSRNSKSTFLRTVRTVGVGAGS